MLKQNSGNHLRIIELATAQEDGTRYLSLRGTERGRRLEEIYGSGFDGVQQDALISAESKDGLYRVYGVADGMGGSDTRGASLVAANILKAVYEGSVEGIPSFREDKFKLGQRMLYRSVWNRMNLEAARVKKDAGFDLGNIGATFGVVTQRGEDAYITHAGNVRVYTVLDDGSIQLRTLDHSRTQTLLSDGIITDEQACVHDKKHTVASAVMLSWGPDPAGITVQKLDLTGVDRVIVGSDGIIDELMTCPFNHSRRYDAILALTKVLSETSSAQETCEALRDAALMFGKNREEEQGKTNKIDNMSVIVAKMTHPKS